MNQTDAAPAVRGIVDNLNQFNMSSIAWDNATLLVPTNTTGCLRPGALPIPMYSFNCTLHDLRSATAFRENSCRPNNTDVCLPGFLCPNSTVAAPPQYCPPTEECLLIRSSKGTCKPQGHLEPSVCPPGHYCPAPGKVKLICPKGHYCPQGSFQPTRCAIGSRCPRGSRRQVTLLPVYLTVAVDLTLVLIAVWYFLFSKRKITKRPPKKAKNKVPEVDAEDASLHPFITREKAEADELPETPEIQRLMQSFRECIGAKNVGLSFEFNDLSFEPAPGKRILTSVSGAIQSGSFWAVMGGSGAGKSTFLNVLMGKTKHTSGSVLVNGHQEKMKKYKKLIGYVPQDDIVLPELTVRENILYSARIRLPSAWSDQRKQEHADTLIACLGLSHVADSLVGDPRKPVISGGQRKRVSIGLELAAAPMALFLDEPTSGLDATSAASVMSLLKSISCLGVTTIAIIHQPRQEVFESINNLLLLGNGQEMFAGRTRDVAAYFNNLNFTFPKNRNPADVIMDIAAGSGQQYSTDLSWREDSVQTLIDKWRTHLPKGDATVIDTRETDSEIPRSATENPLVVSTTAQEDALQMSIEQRGAAFPLQVWFSFERAMLQQLRNSGSFFFEVGLGALTGAVIGLSAFSSHGQLFKGIYHFPFIVLSSAVDYQSATQVGLLGGLAIGLAASAAGVKIFGDEKLTYWREAASGHNRYAYYAGKVLSTLIRMTLSCLHFSICLGVLATPLMPFSLIFAANLLYFYCIYGFSSCISMVTRREDGPLLAVMGSLIIGILGGVAPPLSKVKHWRMEWLWRMSPGTWYAEMWFTENVAPLDYLYIIDLASEATGFEFHQVTLDMCVLFAIGTIYRIIACALMVLVKRHKQR